MLKSSGEWRVKKTVERGGVICRVCTVHIAIAVIIHSFDPTRTIALVIRSVDPYKKSTPNAGAIKRMDNERDSLGGFHMRIAAFDAGCANAAAGRAINREKGWCALRTLHNVHPTTTITIRRHFVQYQ